jgi:hypothetical protein
MNARQERRQRERLERRGAERLRSLAGLAIPADVELATSVGLLLEHDTRPLVLPRVQARRLFSSSFRLGHLVPALNMLEAEIAEAPLAADVLPIVVVLGTEWAAVVFAKCSWASGHRGAA